MYSWWQCLLVCCAISLSDGYREHSFSNDSLNLQTDREKSNSKTLFKLLRSPDKQHPINQIPFWKLDVVSDAPTSSPISDLFSPLPKAYKWDNGRLVKRDVENTDAFMIAFRAAIKEAVKEYLAENKDLAYSFQREGLQSGANDNSGHLPSDVEVNFLKRILSKDISTESVHQIEPFLENGTPELAQALRMQPVEEKLYTSKPVGTFAVSNEQFLSKLQTKLKRPATVTTSTSGTSQSVPYPTSAKKSKTSKRVTVAGSSSNISNNTSVRPLKSSDSQSSEKQENLNAVTKDPFSVVTSPVLESSSLENIWISSFITSAENLDSIALPSTKKYPSNDGLVTGIMAAGLLTSNKEITFLKPFSSPSQHYIPQNDQTNNPKYSFPTDSKLSDAYQITSSKEKLVPFSKMESTTKTATVTSVMPIKSDFPRTHIYTPKSADHEIFETGGDEEEPSNTPRTPDSATLSSEQLFSSTKGNLSTEATSFETTSEVFSTVTLLPVIGREKSECTLKVCNTTTTLHEPLTKQTTYENSKTGYLAQIKTSPNTNSGTSMLSPTRLPSSAAFSQFKDSYSTEPVEVSSIIPLHLIGHTPFPESTKLDSTKTFSSFTDAFSASHEPSDFPETETNSDVFYDAINGNTKSNQMTFNVTSTQSPAFLSYLFNDLISMTRSWKSASPSIQKVTSAALRHAETSRGHITSHSPAIPSTTQADFEVSRYGTSNVKSFLTIAQSRSQITETSSKLWKPRSSFIVPSQSSTSAIHTKSSATIMHGLNSSSPKPTDLTSMVPESVTSPPPPKLFFTVSHNNETTLKPISSTSTSEAWKPQSSILPPSGINAETSVTAAYPPGYKHSTISPKSSIFSSSTYISSHSQNIPKITHMKSAASQSVTTTSVEPSSVDPSKSASFTMSPRSTTIGFLPSRPFFYVFPPKSTSGAFTSYFTTSNAFLQKSATTRAPTVRKPRVITVIRRKGSTTTPKLSQQSKTTQTIPESTSTSTVKPPFTISKSKTEEVTHTSSITFRKTTKTLAFKAAIPQASNAIPTKLTTSVPTKSEGLPDILKTPQTTLYSTTAVVMMPLTFHLTGISYSDQLNDNTTKEYKNLEKEVMLVLEKIFATKYQQDFVQVQILGFSKGSVVVNSEIIFSSNSPAPSGSDIVRTVLSDTTKNNFFEWNINASTVESDGFTPKNLEQESLSISFVVLYFGFIAISQNDQEKQNYLKGLQNEILGTINKTFQATNISFSQIRDLHGDLDVRGILYIKTSTFTNVDILLSTLLPLANESLDLRSITVEGMHNELKVYPFNIRITNFQFAVDLLDMASNESQKLSKDLSKEIVLALRDKSLLQVVVREFYSGSVVCKGDLIYRFPAPGSGEVLRQFLLALRPDGTLGSSAFKVDFKSVTIDDATSTPYNEYIDFPGFAVAIIVMCGLSILIFPLLVFVCYKTQMLGHRKKATIPHRHEPDKQSHRLEMDNRAFRASIEQP